MKFSLPNKQIVDLTQIKAIDPTDIGNLALDIWRLHKKLAKLEKSVDKELLKPIEYCLQSCERSLTSMGITTKDDYDGKPYQSSMNLDVVSYETARMDSAEAIVKETLEPAILLQTELLHKAKVVVVTPEV